MVDAAGRVVGLNTHRAGDGFYLALPTDAAFAARVDALARGETPRRVRLGVALAPPPVARRLRGAVGLDDRDGLLIRAVDDDGPAARADLRAGDLIVAVDGTPVASVDDLLAALEQAGDRVDVDVVRGAEERRVTVSFDPPEPSAD